MLIYFVSMIANLNPISAQAKARFLELLRDTCNVSASAKGAGVDRSNAYKARKADPQFAEAWDDALEQAYDEMEAEARRRAFKGHEESVYYMGVEIGKVRKFSDGLCQFLLSAYRSKFNPKSTIDVNVQGEIAQKIVAARKRAGG